MAPAESLLRFSTKWRLQLSSPNLIPEKDFWENHMHFIHTLYLHNSDKTMNNKMTNSIKISQWSLTCISGKPLHWWLVLTNLSHQMICTTSKFCTTFQRRKQSLLCPDQINLRWQNVMQEFGEVTHANLKSNHCLYSNWSSSSKILAKGWRP